MNFSFLFSNNKFMMEKIIHIWTVRRVFSKAFVHKISEPRWNPFRIWGLGFCVCNFIHSSKWIEIHPWWLPGTHFINRTPKAPNISWSSILLSCNHLWSHPKRSSFKRLCLFILYNTLWFTKIRKFTHTLIN